MKTSHCVKEFRLSTPAVAAQQLNFAINSLLCSITEDGVACEIYMRSPRFQEYQKQENEDGNPRDRSRETGETIMLACMRLMTMGEKGCEI